mgnify:CR=1 FL=1
MQFISPLHGNYDTPRARSNGPPNAREVARRGPLETAELAVFFGTETDPKRVRTTDRGLPEPCKVGFGAISVGLKVPRFGASTQVFCGALPMSNRRYQSPIRRSTAGFAAN